MLNDGSEAQARVQAALVLMERKYPTSWVRLYDSKSAGLGQGGNVIPPQPADYIVVTDKQACLLEIKSSNTYKSLAATTLRSMFKENQIMGARMWRRAGRGAYCVFYSLQTKQFELWHMRDIVEAYLAPARNRKLKVPPVKVFTEKEMVEVLYLNLI